MADDFERFVEPHRAVMRRVAGVTARDVDPDDVVQEALLRAWRKRDTYRADRGSPRAWLLAITADQARRSGRRRQRYTLTIDDASDGGESLAAHLDVRRAVDALSLRQRQAVLLFYFADLGVSETAKLMGCDVGTVKSTLSDARKKLARELGENDE